MKQSSKAHRCNVANKRNGKEKRKQCRIRSRRSSGESCSFDNENNLKREKYGFSWIKFFNLSVGLNLVNIFSLRCKFNVHYPNSVTFSHFILRIPGLCQKTARYTARLFFHPISYVTVAYCPNIRKLKISSGYEKFRWKGALPNVLGRGRTRRAMQTARKLPAPVFRAILKLALGPLILAKNIVQRRDGVASRRSAIYSKALKWQVKCYRMMPLKSLSTAWGFIHNLYLPVFLRPIFLNWYVKAFRCDLSEAEVEDLKSYKNLGELFRRNLKHGLRPIHQSSQLVSPVDGTILHFGKVERGMIEQVKGITYSIVQFLGPLSWEYKAGDYVDCAPDCHTYTKLIKYNKAGTSLFHCVIYLSPGDYHKFHSPTDWVSTFRRHFAGELLSVNPTIAKIISGLFSLNERAVYVGNWVHGFFSFTAVGATNVGSIRVYDDPELETNTRKYRKGEHVDKNFKEPLRLDKGEKFGEFNLGSTIVLIFEAPHDFTLNITHGQHVKVGEPFV